VAAAAPAAAPGGRGGRGRGGAAAGDAPAAPAPAGPPGGGGGGFGRGGPPPSVTLIVKTQDGREVRGVRRNEDTFSVQMVDASGQLHLFDKLTLAALRVENTSLMPGDYATKLTRRELDNLLAYLGRLRERDLTKTGAAAIPGGITFARLLNADAEPDNWFMYWGNFRGTHFSALKQID